MYIYTINMCMYIYIYICICLHAYIYIYVFIYEFYTVLLRYISISYTCVIICIYYPSSPSPETPECEALHGHFPKIGARLLHAKISSAMETQKKGTPPPPPPPTFRRLLHASSTSPETLRQPFPTLVGAHRHLEALA